MSFHPSFTLRLLIVQAIGSIPLEQPISQSKGLMARAHEWSLAKSSEFSPLAAAVHSCFHADGVSFWLNSDWTPCAQMAWTRPICIPGIRGNFPYSLSTGCRGCHRDRGGGLGESTYSQGLHFPGGNLKLAPVHGGKERPTSTMEHTS